MMDYKIQATNEHIGKVHDFYIDDEFWIIRYIVVDTGNWLPGRQVLLSPFSIQKPDWKQQIFSVNLTKEQVENSPETSAAQPVSRQKEIELVEYYGWPSYWAGATAGLPGAIGAPPANMIQEEAKQVSGETNHNPHLRSCREINNYVIQSIDGDFGHVDDFIVDETAWIIRYLVADTRNWFHLLPGGTKVLIAQRWIESVDWANSKLAVDLTTEQVKQSPEFDPSIPINRDYEMVLFDYYGRPKYWIDA
jgi:hypothetical protein